MTKDLLRNLQLPDIHTFLEVRRSGSFSSAASRLRVTPSQVSKAISRLESTLDVTLFHRDRGRIWLSREGESLGTLWERLAADLTAAVEGVGRVPTLSVAAPLYLLAEVAPALAREALRPRLRCIELSPETIASSLLEPLFDVALLAPPLGRLPPGWSEIEVGPLPFGLYGSAKHHRASGPMSVATATAALEFVIQVRPQGGQHVFVDDEFPVPPRSRNAAGEATSFAAALSIVAETRAVAFGPEVVAAPRLRTGELVQIPLHDLPAPPTLALVHHVERIRAREIGRLEEIVRACFGAEGPSAPRVDGASSTAGLGLRPPPRTASPTIVAHAS